MSTEARVSTLEQAMAELAQAQLRTQANIDRTQENIQANFDRRLASIDRRQAAFDRRQANIDRLSQETSEFRVKDQAMRDEAARRDAQFHAEMHAMQERDDKAAAAFRREMGELSRKMGTLTEDIVAPGIPGVFRERFRVEAEECLVWQKPRHEQEPGRRREFEAVAWGGNVFLLVETRSASDIDEIVAALAEVRSFFPEAEGRRVLGALASFRADPSLVQAAERRGLLVFGLSGGLLDVLNTPGFEPREF
jgi:hypothetical protein